MNEFSTSPTLLASELIDGGCHPFEAEIEARRAQIADSVGGSRILLIGGAGTIGSATLRVLLEFSPASVHVVDSSENGLAELTRDLRSRAWASPLPALRFVPVDYGSPLMSKVLEEGPFDHVLNFAALKHVRSEQDSASTLRILDVNVLALMRLLRRMEEDQSSEVRRLFSVSTDKAADPVGLMGASKRLMEAVLLASDWKVGTEARTSARFANVAFSAGSLLESWTFRVQKGQPMACPEDTRRFLITATDAGRLCTLAAFCIDGQIVAIPSEAARIQEWHLVDVAVRFLESHGLKPVFMRSEEEARGSVESLRKEWRYPLLLTPRDTTGEKQAESFLGVDEKTVPLALDALVGVSPVPIDLAALEHLETQLELMIAGRAPDSKKEIVALLSDVMPRLDHRETGQHLNDRM